MPDTDAELYLPLTKSTLQRVLDLSLNWQDTLSGLSMPELASLCLLNGLGTAKASACSSPERLLAGIIEILNEKIDQSDREEVLDQTRQRLNRKRIQAGFDQLAGERIQLLDTDSCQRRDYLTADGQWDYQFSTNHRQELARQRISARVNSVDYLLSVEQTRLYRNVIAEVDEHIHVQGYAGTGKSLLIKSLITLLQCSTGRVLVITRFKRQLQALGLRQFDDSKVRACTFGALAELVIPDDLTSAANQNMRRQQRTLAPQPDSELINYLNIQPNDAYSPEQMITAIRSTVYRFCLSPAETIKEEHIPARHAARFSSLGQSVVAEYARRYWQAILSPVSANFRPQIRDFHRIKWAAMNRWSIPDHFTHVLVDECHDLPVPVHQILSCSPQARVTLGDDYQNLFGQSSPRENVVRQREMVESVRSGPAVESIVNPIIQIHPSRTKSPFKGNNRDLSIRYYQKTTVPDRQTVILCSTTWGLFEWSQRLALAGLQARLLGEPRYLDMFVQDLMELKAGRSLARHAELFRYRSWDHLATKQQDNRSFKRVEQMLNKGYSYQHWRQTYLRFLQTGQPGALLGLVESVRNLEFDRVMLTPDVLETRAQQSRTAFASMIYVAVTRARRELIVPETLREWIEEINAVT